MGKYYSIYVCILGLELNYSMYFFGVFFFNITMRRIEVVKVFFSYETFGNVRSPDDMSFS